MNTPRIGTYNVLIPRTDTPVNEAHSWRERREAVVNTIVDEFEIVGLQECNFGEAYEQGEFIVEELERRHWQSYIPSKVKLFNDHFHERLPIFWKPEIFELEEAGQIELSSWSPHELEQVPILEKRYSSFIKGRLHDGRSLLFFTLHLQHAIANASPLELALARMKREESQSRLLQTLGAKVHAHYLVIVAGDFNTAEPLFNFEESLLLEVAKAAKVKERWSYNSFHDWKAPAAGKHIDRIFVTAELAGGVAKIGTSLASDHFPVSYQLPALLKSSH